MLKLLFGGLISLFRSRRDLALENLVLRHQLQVALRTNPSPSLLDQDRIFWVWTRRLWPRGWRDHLVIVRASTVLHWHRKGWRLYWIWKSRTRPRLNNETRDLIARMWRENPRWGTERIRGELLKLGIVVSNGSIRRYRWRKPGPADSQAWRPFLANHLKGLWVVDLLVVHTINYGVLYVFFFVSYERREQYSFQCDGQSCHCVDLASGDRSNTLEPPADSSDPRSRRGLRGRFDSRLSRLEIAGLRTPVRSPTANAIAERLVRTIRNECLDHIIVFNERHLRGVLLEFADYYNRDRPHRSLRLASLVPASVASIGEVASRPVLGGLHHVYYRAA